jgi:hypothetical protein
MPTQHRRISITEDPELAAALRAVAALAPETPRPARLVRDLAIRGADAVLAERREREAALERLVDWSTNPSSGMDRDVLLHGRDAAWGAGR